MLECKLSKAVHSHKLHERAMKKWGKYTVNKSTKDCKKLQNCLSTEGWDRNVSKSRKWLT